MWGFLLRIITSVILTGISAYLAYRKPERINPGTLDDLGNPRAEEGEEIIKVFGTVIADLQVVWFGDFSTRPIQQKGGRKYGLFGPKQKTTIGFRYSLGIHFVLCLGPVDYVRRIRVDKRIAWEGASSGSPIGIDKPYLFGALTRERGTGNGVGGTIDVLMGEATQPVNSYLAAVTPAPVPAYRGVTSLVARSFYVGNSPTLRPWEVRVSRIFACDEGYNNGAQWYPEKAAISRPTVGTPPEDTIYDLDAIFPNLASGDLGYPTPIADYPATITIGPFDQPRLVKAGPGGARGDDRLTFNGDEFGSSFTTHPEGTVFFSLAAGETVTVGVRNLFDPNTGATGSLAVGLDPVAAEKDMNPVHILREVLISPDSGGTGVDAEAGDTWEAAADTVFEEGFGISIAWRGATDRVEFKKEIERHIDARSYIDRRTGLWEIKLIRDDYDVGDLPIFDTTNVVSWSEVRFPEASSLINQLVVKWRDLNKDEDSSLTISNPARIRMNGSQVFPEKVEYKGITRADLASRVAMRDLSARSAPLVTGEFRAKNFPTNLNIGSPIIINNPRLGLVNRVVRVTEIDDGETRDSSTTVRYLEDRFALGEEADLEIEIIEPVSDTAIPVDPRMVEEAPLQLLREQLGQPNVDVVLAEDDQAGFLFIAGGRPSSTSRDAFILRDLGSGYEDLGGLDFSLSATTLGRMTNRADYEKVVVETTDDLLGAEGGRVWIGGEHFVVDLVEEGDTSSLGDYWEPSESATLLVFTLTLKRGVMDTVPSVHLAGSSIIFYDDFGFLEDDIQTDGDEADVKLLTATFTDVLDEGSAPIDSVEFASRALRPYPPGDLKLDGDYETDPPVSDVAYVLTWEHRDRTVDGTFAHEEAGPVSPEAGTEYVVTVEALDESGTALSVLTSTNVGDDLTYTWTPVAGPDAALFGRFTVTAIRDTFESWQSPSILFRLDIGERVVEESDDGRRTEDDSTRTIEG